MLRAPTRLALAALLLGSCSQAPANSGPPDGATLFREQNCVQCHGTDGSGTNLGPTLHGKKQYWTREKIALYLADPPATIRGDKRLSEQAKNYMLPMIPFPLSLEQRLALADYVLALP
jgi:mono/diheme cytochrome c family protein